MNYFGMFFTYVMPFLMLSIVWACEAKEKRQQRRQPRTSAKEYVATKFIKE